MFIHHPAYKTLHERLADVPTSADFTQEQLTVKMSRQPLFVSKEAGDQRLDVVEYIQWMLAVNMAPTPIVKMQAADMETGRQRCALN